MKKISLAIFIGTVTAISSANAWDIKKQVDIMTDEIRTQSCKLDSGQKEICFYYNGHELWLTVTLAEQETNVFAVNRGPILRIDKNKLYDEHKVKLRN